MFLNLSQFKASLWKTIIFLRFFRFCRDIDSNFLMFSMIRRNRVKCRLADLNCTKVHRILYFEDPTRCIYTGCKLHPGVGFWSGAPSYGAPPFFSVRVPHSGFTPTALPGERQWVGHFLAALIRRVANIAGNFIRPLYPSFYYYRRPPYTLLIISEYDRWTKYDLNRWKRANVDIRSFLSFSIS